MNFRLQTAMAFLILFGAALECRADEGMWLFNRPPVAALKDRYDFTPSPQWLEHLQKSCVRVGAGGSGSLVSADGLVMTNHHVGRDQIQNLSTADWDLLKEGFVARNRNEELRCGDLEVVILWSIEDVTGRVTEAAQGKNSAEANEARETAIAEITRESKEQTGLFSEVVTLYHGARFHLYRYKRFTDVRLVMAPESSIAAFGGDTDNFEYPRFCLDMCFFRIYENGQPFRPTHFLKWNAGGANDGDLVFIAGHPARTQRLYTFDHLRFLRDTAYPSTLNRLWRGEVKLLNFAARNAEFARIAGEDLLGFQNSRKAYTGMLAGLHDPVAMMRKYEQEKNLREAVSLNPEYQQQWGDAWRAIAEAQESYASFFLRRNLLQGRRSAVNTQLFNIARMLVRLPVETAKPDGERLPEYRESALESLRLRLFSPAPIYRELEIDRLASGLSLLAETFGADDPITVKAMGGQSPRARAEALVAGTSLLDVEKRRELADGGLDAIVGTTDPMVRFALELDPAAREFQHRYKTVVQSAEREAYAKIAAAKFALEGESSYPDATFTLRFSFGEIKGYREGGKRVPAFTNFSGLYERMEERGGTPPFDLPRRWVAGKESLELSTPFNHVCTADIIGGNSGSPVVDRQGEVIGLVFDGNIHSLVWNAMFTDEQARAVSVDSRAIIEALQKIYVADNLANELLGG